MTILLYIVICYSVPIWDSPFFKFQKLDVYSYLIALEIMVQSSKAHGNCDWERLECTATSVYMNVGLDRLVDSASSLCLGICDLQQYKKKTG